MAEHTETAPTFEVEPEVVVQHESMWQKLRHNPMVPLGVSGMVGMVAYGGWNYKNRGSMSTSVYLMHLRVKAQSMVVGALTIGATYHLIKDLFKPPEGEESKK